MLSLKVRCVSVHPVLDQSGPADDNSTPLSLFLFLSHYRPLFLSFEKYLFSKLRSNLSINFCLSTLFHLFHRHVPCKIIPPSKRQLDINCVSQLFYTVTIGVHSVNVQLTVDFYVIVKN